MNFFLSLMGEIIFWPQSVQKVDSAAGIGEITIQQISVRETNCAMQWIEIYPADIFMYREGVENNNFVPSIVETKWKNWKTSVICPTCCI